VHHNPYESFPTTIMLQRHNQSCEEYTSLSKPGDDYYDSETPVQQSRMLLLPQMYNSQEPHQDISVIKTDASFAHPDPHVMSFYSQPNDVKYIHHQS